MPRTACGVIKGVDGEIYEDVLFYRWDPEHGHLRLHDPNRDLKIGDLIEIVPFYPMTDLHDKIFGIRKGEIEAIWSIFSKGTFR